MKYFVLLLSLNSVVLAINSPQIRCVTVLSNGSVQLHWTVPSDPTNEFQSYELYYSPTGTAGSFTLTQSITTYTNNWGTVAGINANIAPYYFYVQVKNTSNVNLPAIDTVKTIYLVLNSPVNASIAALQWGDFHNPLPAGISSLYKIYRGDRLNNWTQIGTVPTNTTGALYYFNDTINICSDSLNYRIELFDPVLSCTSVSNVRGTWFKDHNAPSPPMLDSVSVDINGNVVMGIHPSYSSDVTCYVVYQSLPLTYNPIDTPCTGNTPVVYTYTNSSAGSSSEEFSLAAIDSCGNISVIALNGQKTIYLYATYDICGKTATLNWNAYKNMKGGVHHYEILYSVNGGVYNHLADTDRLVYFHRNLLPGASYSYRVRAHSVLKNNAGKDSITSTSNKFLINTAMVNTPGFVYLSDVTVDNPSEITTVKWIIDSTVKVGSFTIYRADSYNGPYTYLMSTGYINNQWKYSVNDNSANASQQKYSYYVKVLDTCGNFILKSDSSYTILLTAATNGKFGAVLNWSNYGNWPTGVSGYNIYRSLDGTFSGGPIATVPVGTNTYVDDLSAYTTHEGKFSYYVEAIEAAGNPHGLSEISQSNQTDVYLDAMMFVPNAFVPKGNNKIFLPVGDYIEKTEYKLTIFDRWGDKIFQSTDENTGWDGGKYPEGLYGYLIEYVNALGEHRQQQGTVTLVR
ncbi:MAG: T9SS type B sorting domain-containing protein [Bacteroidia bacterium]